MADEPTPPHLGGDVQPPPSGAALTRIRVETALSRFPIHRLAKKGTVEIDITNGDSGLSWRVTYAAAFGEPGPLAYKLDTLVVNRRIDEAPRPLPDMIRIGSLSEIARELGLSGGKNLTDIKRAFYQNASAFIVAHLRYRTKSGKERWREIGWSRYAVLFTGDELPDGRIADAVYIIPNATYRDLLNEAEVRPLDYDYLRDLAPGPQRFYELLSFQIYGAIASGRPRAKLLYGNYCALAPQARYPDWEHVRKQMYKIHAPHLASGYIAKAEFESTLDEDGDPDWAMLYTPGPRARAEFEAFSRRERHTSAARPILTSLTDVAEIASTEGQHALALGDVQVDATLVKLLVDRGIDAQTAGQILLRVAPGQDVELQIAYIDDRLARDKRIANPAGFLIDVLRKNRPVPRAFMDERRRAKSQAVSSSSVKDVTRVEDDYRDAKNAAYAAMLASIPESERASLREQGRLQAVADAGDRTPAGFWMERLIDGAVRDFLERAGRFTFPEFAAWRAQRATEHPSPGQGKV